MGARVTFDGQPPAGTINLGIGQPSVDLLPVELLRGASESFFRRARPAELNYGVLAGDARFLHSLGGYLSAAYGQPVDPQSLFLSGGSSQALDLVSTVFAKPGDTIFVEEPSYFLAFQIFRDHGLQLVGIPIDDEGLDIEALQAALKVHRPAFVYTIPSYHNPGGQCLSAERRRQLVELGRQHNFLIVADEVYQLLYYYDPPPPALGTMIDSEQVLSLGSFSKILAPAMRLGWIQTSPRLLDRLTGNGLVSSGGSLNHYASHIVRQAIDLGLLDAHVRRLRRVYRSRVEAMDAALHAHFADLAEWTRPAGGYFFWLRFGAAVDTASLREKARENESGFQAGSVFSTEDNLDNYLRLSFAHYGEDDISEGIARLRPLFD